MEGFSIGLTYLDATCLPRRFFELHTGSLRVTERSDREISRKLDECQMYLGDGGR